MDHTAARKLLLGTALGDVFLYLLFRGEIPHRDYFFCRLSLVTILFLSLFEMDKRPTKRPDTKRFRSLFATLSTMEVLFTILIPWLIILEGILSFSKVQTAKNGHLLASHLFIFQTQIAGECIIEMAGEHRKWMIFPFTCIANLYRGVSIATWISRVMNEAEIESRDIILPTIAACLWLYSSFVFIPREWLPLLNKI
jgi:hypothetical protein